MSQIITHTRHSLTVATTTEAGVMTFAGNFNYGADASSKKVDSNPERWSELFVYDAADTNTRVAITIGRSRVDGERARVRAVSMAIDNHAALIAFFGKQWLARSIYTMLEVAVPPEQEAIPFDLLNQAANDKGLAILGILAHKHPDDQHLYTVLARTPRNEFAVWTWNRSIGGFHNGQYHRGINEAYKAFLSRASTVGNYPEVIHVEQP